MAAETDLVEGVRLVAIGPTSPVGEFALSKDEVTIGSAPSNDLIIEDATVSRRHARLTRAAAQDEYQITDLGSTNGTYVNGRRVLGSAPIRKGDELRVGAARFTLLGAAQQGEAAPGRGPASAAAAPTASVSAPSARPGAAAAGQAAATDGALGADRLAARPQSAPPHPEPRSKALRRATAIAVVTLLFVGSFAITDYVIYWNGLERAADLFQASPAASGAAALAPGAGGSLGPSGVTSPGAKQATAGVSPAASVAPTSVGTPAVEADAVPHKHRRVATPAPLAPESEAETIAWLEPLNSYRSMVHLPPVVADPALSEGDAEHARYLVKNYGKIIKANALGIEAHSEDPSKPFYSTTGARAAAASNVDEGWRAYGPPAVSPGQAISGWVGIAFHRLWILNPGLRRAGYGGYCQKGVCAGALDVLSGADPIRMTTAPFANPIQFPPPGSVMRMRSAEGEWPDPLTACAGYTAPSGLPITLELGAHVNAKFSGYTLTLAGVAPAAIEACGFDANSYINPDPVAEKRVRDALNNFGAAVLIPRAPLTPGTYDVAMTVGGRRYAWSFTISP
jgi:FHA domain